MRLRGFVYGLGLMIVVSLPAAAQTVINACVDSNKGTVRIVKAGETCDQKEYALSWNQQGVPPVTPPPVQIGTITIDKGSASPIYALSSSATLATSTSGGGGGVVGKASFSNIIIVRKADSTSPALLADLAAGKHVKSVLIALTPGPSGPRTINLEDVFVNGYSFTTLPGTTDPMESVSFNFAKITVTYDGATMCWDVKADSGC